MTPGALVLLCGLPGSGKTTVARELVRTRDAIRLCPDYWMASLGVDLFDEEMRARIETLQWELAQEMVQRGLTVVIEWGVWSRAERDAVRVRARELGARVELRFLDEPVGVLWERVKHRNETGPPGTPIISRDDLAAWSTRFEPPDAQELSQFDS